MSARPITTIESSNSLVDLAARISAEHTAVATALKDSARHAIAAGELLIEAKDQIPHGQWLPWLRDHCTISERTAQLYIRVAKNRAEIERQIRNDVADLSLNEATALLVLSSNVRKLLNFARDLEHLSGEELVQRCIAENVAVVQTPNYDPFVGRTEAERVEWLLYIVFQSFDGAARRSGGDPSRVADHVEWILRRPFQSVAEWLGNEGDKWRKQQRMRPITADFKADWAAFLDLHCDWTLQNAIEKFESLQQEFAQARAEGRLRINGAP